MRFPSFLQNRSRYRALVVLAACFVLVAVLGYVDYVTGPEIGFAVFYMVPVALAAWYAGGWSGFGVAVVSTGAWYLAEALWPLPHSSPMIPYWNATTRLFIFLATAGMVSALGRALQDLERKVEERTASLVREIAERKQVEAVLRQSRDEVRSLAGRLSLAEEEERKRMARELHDQVVQTLAVIGMNLSFVKATLSRDAPAETVVRLDEAMQQLEEAARRIREIMSELRPLVLDDYGLTSGLQGLAEQFRRRGGIRVEVFCDNMGSRSSPEREIALFRIAQEALTNIGRHAQADEARIELETGGDRMRMTIIDDGVGFDLTAVASKGRPHGMGLLSMRERAIAVGGTCRIESQPGKGTRVIAEIGC